MLIFGNYIITFILYPDITIRKKFDWDEIWSGVILILVYNIGDTLGRLLGDRRWTFNSKSSIYGMLSRLYFLISITILANGVEN